MGLCHLASGRFFVLWIWEACRTLAGDKGDNTVYLVCPWLSQSYCFTAIVGHFPLSPHVSDCLLEVPIWIPQCSSNLIYPKFNALFFPLSPTTNPARRPNVISDSLSCPFLQSHNNTVWRFWIHPVLINILFHLCLLSALLRRDDLSSPGGKQAQNS